MLAAIDKLQYVVYFWKPIILECGTRTEAVIMMYNIFSVILQYFF